MRARERVSVPEGEQEDGVVNCVTRWERLNTRNEQSSGICPLAYHPNPKAPTTLPWPTWQRG